MELFYDLRACFPLDVLHILTHFCSDVTSPLFTKEDNHFSHCYSISYPEHTLCVKFINVCLCDNQILIQLALHNPFSYPLCKIKYIAQS